MSEASAVQNPMLRYAAQIGWDYINRPEAMQRRNGNAKELYLEGDHSIRKKSSSRGYRAQGW